MFPLPLVAACNGHALAMDSFLLLASDVGIGAGGAFKMGANEAAIGLTMPYSAIEICRQRLTPAHLTRAAITAKLRPLPPGHRYVVIDGAVLLIALATGLILDVFDVI